MDNRLHRRVVTGKRSSGTSRLVLTCSSSVLQKMSRSFCGSFRPPRSAAAVDIMRDHYDGDKACAILSSFSPLQRLMGMRMRYYPRRLLFDGAFRLLPAPLRLTWHARYIYDLCADCGIPIPFAGAAPSQSPLLHFMRHAYSGPHTPAGARLSLLRRMRVFLLTRSLSATICLRFRGRRSFCKRWRHAVGLRAAHFCGIIARIEISILGAMPIC